MLRLFSLCRTMSQKVINRKVSPQPRLPPELERIIFSYAYENNTKDIRNLILVARRAEEWLYSPIFKVTILLSTRRSPLKRLTLSTFLRYGKYINYLALNLSILKSMQDPEETLVESFFNLGRMVNPRFLVKVLTACPNLVHFWIFIRELMYTKISFPVLSPLITHLAIQLSLLLEHPQLSSNIKKSKSNSALDPLFPAITHIQVLGTLFKQGEEDHQSLLLSIHFPNLTHLALHTQNVVPKQEEGLKLALDRCSKLDVVVLMRFVGDPELCLSLPVAIVDLALPSEPIDPWKAGARGEGKDIWDMVNDKRQVAIRSGGRNV